MADSAGASSEQAPLRVPPDADQDDHVPDILGMSDKEQNLEDKEDSEDPTSVLQTDALSPGALVHNRGDPGACPVMNEQGRLALTSAD